MFVRRYRAVWANPTMNAPFIKNGLPSSLYRLVTDKDLCQLRMRNG